MNIGSWKFQAPCSAQNSTQHAFVKEFSSISVPLFLAPMAGITDRPFRQLCRKLGAAMSFSEMVTSKPELFNSQKTQSRLNHEGENKPIAVQILGTQADQMAQAAQYNIRHGADIIDINMGCPAKKVCNVLAGSALLKDELLVSKILSTVVQASSVPVTLKIRTGWDKSNKNAPKIAQIAQECGVQALTIHGRTRACGYQGDAEYETIRRVKEQVGIPIIANGDINSAEKALQVIQYTGVDAIMIGRSALKSPWIFADINHFLMAGEHLAEPSIEEKCAIMLGLLNELYIFYGAAHGVRIARKHIASIVKPLSNGTAFWQQINQVKSARQQYTLVSDFFNKQLQSCQ